MSSKVGYILPDSQASIANFQEGDIIQKVDGKDVESRADVQMLLSRRLGDTGIINFSVNSEGINMEKMIPIQNWLINEEPKDLLADLGIGVPISSEIGDVIENSPASDAGLLTGDVVKLINSKKISSWGQIKDEITNSLGMPLEISIARNGEEILKSIIPRPSESGWIIGISSANKISEDALFFKSYALHSAFINAVKKTYSTIRDSFTFLYKMLTGYVSPKNLGGPVMIGQFAGDTLLYGGIYSFLMLMSFVSIGLGVINLVPIPILDGGQICLLTLEKIKGSPLSPKTLDFVYRAGLSMVIFLMIFVFINDISRLSGA